MTRTVYVEDWGRMGYNEAWQRQETLLAEALAAKKRRAAGEAAPIQHRLILVEHPHVYTLGKSGKEAHLLQTREELAATGIDYMQTNRGGDITYHGPGQIVGYPILDLEDFYTDIGRYLRSLEEVIVRTIAHWGLTGERSAGETGVWLDPAKPVARKICAMGVRCSRWVTMHGFALNVNTDLAYFDNIVPCGIVGKGVASMHTECERWIDEAEVKRKLVDCFGEVFESRMEISQATHLHGMGASSQVRTFNFLSFGSQYIQTY